MMFFQKNYFIQNWSGIKTTSCAHTKKYIFKIKSYSKKKFDPFCRRDRIEFTLGEEKVISTLGQLNFFKCAINNLILDYIKINYKCIENDMNICYNSIHKKKETNIRKKVLYQRFSYRFWERFYQ